MSNRNSGSSGSSVGVGVGGVSSSRGGGAAAVAAKRIFIAMLPSFVTDFLATRSSADSNRHGSPDRTGRRRATTKLHATSYLDGLRGLAACSVFAYHYTDYNHKFFLPLYGYNTGDPIPSSLMQLPYVRLLYSGAPMVHIFFVISGFALSLRPLQCLYNFDGTANNSNRGPTPAGQAKSQALIASSAFRRPIRLFIPPLGATALAAFVVFVLGWMPSFMKPQATLWAQITDWAYDATHKVMWPWNWDDMDGSPHSRYNPHLWTIPMEFVHSMFLFLVLLVLTRMRGAATRQIVLAGLMVYTLLITRWAAFEFLAGAFLAEMHLATQFEKEALSSRLPGHGHGEKKVRYYTLKKTLQTGILIAAGYLLSWPPRKDDMTPTFTWIESLAPSDYGNKGKNFWLAIAAFGTVWAVGKMKFIKNRILTSSLAQYAGKISFCLYIFQHLILNLMQHHTLGSEYKPATETRPEEQPWGVRGTFGISGVWQRTITWWVGLMIMGFVLVCLADFGTRMLDGPAVRLAKRAEALAFGSSTSTSDPRAEQIPMLDINGRVREEDDERLEK
ncbi:Acyltransferase family domain containing protein [Naviculisporaceae sp. PSN 640]